jgi:L-threonylcarbamoyladenylate synthase
MVPANELRRAAELIRAGRLVAFPTETVYGLGANALDPDAVARIFAAKGRPPGSPLIVHVASVAMAKQLVSDWTEAAERLTASFWPGPLTLVLPKQARVPDRVSAGLPTVGVRMPAHPVALAMIRAAGVPVAAPSANRFTELSPTRAEHVRDSLGSAVDLILDGGPTDIGIESTVLSLVSGMPALLRPGMISRRQIEAVVGPVQSAATAGEGSHPAPGMHRRHYSPRTPVVIAAHPPAGKVAWVWWNRSEPSNLSIHMPSSAQLYAAKLYDTLHRLDKEGLDVIAIEGVPDGLERDGVRDSLRRAAAQEEAGDRVI